ncbi:chemotaxis protein CheA [Isachenkonia alkalipeptolytica]|uniref:Chemotaxis protein CheA n=1 Tax=Isachenkonia alkalipeptolytica TaxID=2565777 RepID=A0AA43XJS1_9CLOT|nr:chemotaxis protein CheA [Isachenkonia alkalipeptolytica]NBG87589.1 chemotaxis protein CheA [Isachenkonia alkalipeptolytica]
MDMNQYLDIFIEETKEHLQSMNEILLKLESFTYDKDLLNEMFRIAHTIKGMSGTMGYQNIAGLTHEMENVLDLIRNDELKTTEEIVDILFECFDQLEGYINNIEQEGREGENRSEDLIRSLENIKLGKTAEKTPPAAPGSKQEPDSSSPDPLGNIALPEHVAQAAEKSRKEGLSSYFIKTTLDEKCMLKSARAYIFINRLERVGEIVYSNPSIEDIEDENFDLSFEVLLISKEEQDFLEKEVDDISEIKSIDFTELRGQKGGVDAEEKPETEGEDLPVASPKTPENPAVEKTPASKEKQENGNKGKTGKTVRVDIDRLDNLMNLVSELIIIKTRLEDADGKQDAAKVNETTEYLERITTSLHDAVMKVRMVPIERVFNRFPRMVRDLSKDLSKDIQLDMAGKETEVDRTVIDEIGDPLIHLIRNSIDHGIEGPEVRRESGKEAKGTVRLEAYPDGNTVVIEVEDDGKGIDVEKVKEKAFNKGLITTQQKEQMEDSDAVDLLFTPGFSTADQVSDLSGRGVGLDVVKTKIESLGGDIEVTSKPGIGSKSVIRLPLTLAIIQALLVKVEAEKYAIPLNTIKEITTIHKDKIRDIQGNKVALYRDATLPILKLAELLRVPPVEKEFEDPEHTVVIIRKGDKTAGIIVDDLIGQQEIVIKSLGKFLNNIEGIAGATILGNGTVALIVDTNSFFRKEGK